MGRGLSCGAVWTGSGCLTPAGRGSASGSSPCGCPRVCPGLRWRPGRSGLSPPHLSGRGAEGAGRRGSDRGFPGGRGREWRSGWEGLEGRRGARKPWPPSACSNSTPHPPSLGPRPSSHGDGRRNEMCQVLALRSSAGLLREWGRGAMGARWRGAGSPGTGVVRAEGPRMKAAGDQMWKESLGKGPKEERILPPPAFRDS